MAHQGRLTIRGGNTYDVVECAYDFHQAIDETGKPVTRTQGGTITFVIPASSDEDTFFYKWMFNKTKVYDGILKFVVYANSDKPSEKTVEFFNAYCIDLKDYFNNNDSKLMYSTITISAEKIRIGEDDNVIFTNEWT